MADDELLLSNQLCFALYRASRSITQIYRPLLDELGLTYPQYLVMLVLWERDSLPVKELGTALDLDSGTLSPLLKRLAAAGFISRGRSPEDERSVVVSLTDAGRRLRRRAKSVPGKISCATEMSYEDVVSLRSTLTSLADTLGSHRSSPSSNRTA